MSQGLGFGRRKLINKIVSDNWSLEAPQQKNFSYNELLFVIQEMMEEEGKVYLEPGSSNRGHHIFRDFVKHLLYRNLANYDSMLLISSEKGTGKSSAAIMIARFWCQLLGIRFNAQRHIAYSNADMMSKIDNLNKFEPLIADEAIRFASSADWARKENKILKKKLAQVRTKHLLYILCFPLKVQKVDKVYLESNVNYWCLTGDVKITTRNKHGIISYTRMKYLTKTVELLTYNIKEKIYEFKSFDKKILTKKNAEVFEVELINGLKIKATEDHLFLTKRGYIKLKNLKNDDEILVNTKKCEGCHNDFVPKIINIIYCKQKCRYLKYRDYFLKKAKIHRENNREKNRLYSVNRRKNNPEHARKVDAEWRLKNYDYVIRKNHERWARRMIYDIGFKLRVKLGNQLKTKLKAQKVKKKNSALKYLGCSIEEFKKYLESKFKSGMCWENHGQFGWHIDHIMPYASFDLTKEEDVKKCFHYNNMQPLWWKENLTKHAKIPKGDQNELY